MSASKDASFAALYERHQKKLYAYACVVLRSDALAQDAVQDAVLSAWQNLDSLRSVERFEGWIFKILANCCRAIAKKERRVCLLEGENIPDRGSDTLALSQELRDALEHLAQDEREIILLCVLTGIGGKEAANALGIKHSTLRSKRTRTLAKLREMLE
ncbi:MAG: sigma-70 family RNA polymerase sigma factor [Oscillospiraceae bacterium]|nr:sigma-70 family RNA polymerase sigma factor [Oscillospiraceae bacterium]